MRRALYHTHWEALLVGDAESQALALTTKLLALRSQFVLLRTYLTKATYPAWFVYRCPPVAKAKHSGWRKYMRHQSHHNLVLHREACRRKTSPSKWARKHWEEIIRTKLSDQGVGNKTWWSFVWDRQGITHHDRVHPLRRLDWATSTSSDDICTFGETICRKK